MKGNTGKNIQRIKKSGPARVMGLACALAVAAANPVLAQENVKVTDAAGHELLIDDNGVLKRSGDCIFSIKGNYKGKLLINEKTDGNDNFSELENGSYRVKFTDEKEISFLILDEEKMLYRPVNGLPETIYVKKADGFGGSPKAEFIYEEAERRADHLRLKGKEPVLKLSPSEGMATYIKISSEKGAEKIRLKDEIYEYHFGEGAYAVEVWNEDGFGRRYEAELPFSRFIYKKLWEEKETQEALTEKPEEADEESPEIKKFTAELEGDSLLIKGRCADRLSGMDEVKIYLGKEELPLIKENGEYRAEISMGFVRKGAQRILFRAADKAGNTSEKELEFEIEDDEAPVVKLIGIENMGLYAGDKEFSAEAFDDNLSEVTCVVERMDAGGKVLEHREYPQGKIRLNEEGSYRIRLTARDKNGNTSSLTKLLTIDKNAPGIADLSNIDKKYLKSLSLRKDMSFLISDMTLSGFGLYLNGREYNGDKIDKAGHYVLSIKAKDKAGHTAEKTAEFVIRRNH